MSGAARTRRRITRRWLWLAGLLLLALLSIADHRGFLLVGDDDDLAYHGRAAQVVRVIDGDTIEIGVADPLQERPVTRIRLWGVDCPEAATADRPAEPWAEEATDLVRSLTAGREVTVLTEAHQTRDVFGRLLAHIELADGRNLAEMLLEEGWARADDRWPHSRLGRFAQLETAARRRGVGIWSVPEAQKQPAR